MPWSATHKQQCLLCLYARDAGASVRLRAGFSQQTMAGGLGLDRAALSAVENGNLRRLPITALHRWARVLRLIDRHLQIPQTQPDVVADAPVSGSSRSQPGSMGLPADHARVVPLPATTTPSTTTSTYPPEGAAHDA
jgi:DNA-binding XRE family transcriptional regulator